MILAFLTSLMCFSFSPCGVLRDDGTCRANAVFISLLAPSSRHCQWFSWQFFFTSSKLAYNWFFFKQMYVSIWYERIRTSFVLLKIAFNVPHWSILIILLRCLWVESTQWLLNYNFNRTVSSLSPFMDSSISVSEISQLLEHTFNAVASFTDLFWAFTIIFQKYFFTLWMPIWYCTGLCFFVIHFLMQIRCRDSTARSNTAR